jgi:hypothetical protein
MNQVAVNTLFYALLGTLVHSAGCVINDMLDRDFDRKVGMSVPSGLFLLPERCSIRTFKNPATRVGSRDYDRGRNSSDCACWCHLLHVFNCWPYGVSRLFHEYYDFSDKLF